MMLTPSQCRAARALIAWSQSDLCDAAKVGRATLANFEAEKSTPYERTLRDIRAALEDAGVIFIEQNGNGPGVRLRDRKE
ncbi:transcriptional regulator [Staphylococcus aureus]|nr:helix-turn-helix transcriptional regulator [Brucella pseudintermedia]OWU60626.1 transcriptional regulator [Staphylococcus aureus]